MCLSNVWHVYLIYYTFFPFILLGTIINIISDLYMKVFLLIRDKGPPAIPINRSQ